jgi:murein L,D-transpeptidase YafK
MWFSLLAVLPSLASVALADAYSALPTATRILVEKSDRRMTLFENDRVLRRYRVALGVEPVGPKQVEGDQRTPEGRYRIVARNPRSDFFLSLLVSYPDAGDLERARRTGAKPGGAIMIHGLPNQPRQSPEYYAKTDWTDGCIALSNADMMEVWMLVPENTPIEIRP